MRENKRLNRLTNKTNIMAVVKLKYLRDRKHVKDNLRYIAHRKGERPKETITRALFGNDGQTEKKAFYQAIDAALRGTVFYKFMISPDPAKEDTRKDLDLEHVTRVTIAKLEGELGRQLLFVAAVHDDHTDKRHVHGIFILGKKVSEEQFKALAQTARLAATAEACLERKARDRVLSHPRYRQITASIRSVSAARDKGRGGRAPRISPGCRSCGFGELTGIPGNRLYCPMCRHRLREDREQGLEPEVRS
jgi:hypothetical protein